MRLIDPALRQVLVTAVSGGAGAALSAIAPLITTPIMLGYLGDYRYGLWMMLMSVTALVGLSDFGITNGITTELSHTSDDSSKRRVLISNAYMILVIVALALAVILALAFAVMVVRASTDTDRMMQVMTVAVLLPTILTVPLGFVLRLLYIDLRGSEASIAPGLAALASIGVALVGTRVGVPPAVLVFLFLLTVPAVYAALTVRYFRRHSSLTPARHDWDRAVAGRVLGSGKMFVLLSLLVILCNRLDYLIVAHFVGVVDLVPYAIADRIIGIANAVVTVLGAALWPVFARKIHVGEIAWIRSSILKINTATVLLYAVFTVLLVAFYNELLELWLGTAKETSPSVLIFLSLTSMTIALTAPYFAVANSLGVIKEQMVAYLLLAAISMPLKSFAGAVFGPTGVAAAAFVGWALVMLPIIVTVVVRRLKRADQSAGAAA